MKYILFLLLFLTGFVCGQVTIPDDRIKKGITFLVKHQDKNGFWRADVGNKLNHLHQVHNTNKPHIGVSALAALTLLENQAYLQKTGLSNYQQNITKTLKFILSHQNHTGFIGSHGTRMMSHNFATQFLIKNYAKNQQSKLRKAIVNAVDFIVKYQNQDGSWFYVPVSDNFTANNNIITTGLCIETLCYARQINIPVPHTTFAKAWNFIKDLRTFNDFAYTYLNARRATDPAYYTGMGVHSLFLLQFDMKATTPIITEALRRFSYRKMSRGYRDYYYPSCLWAATRSFWWHDKLNFPYWYKDVKKDALIGQQKDGSWKSPRGKIFGTAITIRTLLVPTTRISFLPEDDNVPVEFMSASELLQSAKQQQEQKKWQQAVDIYNKIISLYPTYLVSVDKNVKIPAKKFIKKQIATFPTKFHTKEIEKIKKRPVLKSPKPRLDLAKKWHFFKEINNYMIKLEAPKVYQLNERSYSYLRTRNNFLARSIPGFNEDYMFINNGVNITAYPLKDAPIWSVGSKTAPWLKNYSNVYTTIVANNTIYTNILANSSMQLKSTWSVYSVKNFIPHRSLVAIEANTGKIKWRAKHNLSFITSPLVIGNVLYVTAYEWNALFNLYVLAIDSKTGKTIWRLPVQSGIQEVNLMGYPARELVGTKLTYDNGTLYAVSNLGSISAINLKGELQWSYFYQPQQGRRDTALTPYTAPAWVNRPPVVAKNKLLVAAIDSKNLHCLDKRSGKLIWKKQTQSYYDFIAVYKDQAILTVQNKLLFVSLQDGTVVAEKKFYVRAIVACLLDFNTLYLSLKREIIALDVDTKKIEYRQYKNILPNSFFTHKNKLIVVGKEHIKIYQLPIKRYPIEKYIEICNSLEKSLQQKPKNQKLLEQLHDNYKELGLAAMDKKKYIFAQKSFERCLSLKSSKEIKKLLLLSQKEEKKQQENFAQAVKLHKQGLLAVKNEKWQEALKHYNKAFFLNSSMPELCKDRGTLYLKLNKVDKAIIDFIQETKNNPKSVVAYNNLGNIFYKQKKAKALQYLNKAIELNSEDAKVYINCGSIKMQQKKWAKALDNLDTAVKLEPKNHWAYYNRGIVHSKLAKTKETIEDFNYAIKIKPDYSKAYYHRGVLYAKTDNLEKAIDDYNKTIKLTPGFADVYYHFAKVYAANKRNKPAAELFEIYLRLSPKGEFAKEVVAYLEKHGQH